jgi:hypothetical protein
MTEDFSFKKYSFNFYDFWMEMIDETSRRLGLSRTDTIMLLAVLGRERLLELLEQGEKVVQKIQIPPYVR